jgi:diadenosine tetraphosphate (Ap4A) HIT family hydrolase
LDNYYIAKNENRAPWTELVREDYLYFVFEDKYPVSPGHLLFVPKNTDTISMSATLGAAFVTGEYLKLRGECDGFNIGMNMGEAAGQTVMYPHIHLIPRRKGDVEDPVGGVRGVIPGQANYRKPGYKNPGDK